MAVPGGSPIATLAAPLAGSVRRVLSGRADGQSQVARAIAQPQGAPGWFRPGDAIWTVHGSVSTFVGGIRSLYLQALHPLALAGVDQHSTYQQDPFGRLQRTGAFLAATTYGSAELAQQTVDAIRVLHRRVRGTAVDGRPYSAQDPRLLEWVHIALVDSMLTAYQHLGRDGDVDTDAYVADMAVVGSRMGVVDPPTSVPELAARFARFQEELLVDDLVHRTHAFVSNAPLPVALRPGYRVLARAAWASLPVWALDQLGSRPRAAALDLAAADATLRVLRAALVASPARLAAERRLGHESPAAGSVR
jgi:uncharacterized protein (DUF2236 family)